VGQWAAGGDANGLIDAAPLAGELITEFEH
jgi:hypothetical protein